MSDSLERAKARQRQRRWRARRRQEHAERLNILRSQRVNQLREEQPWLYALLTSKASCRAWQAIYGEPLPLEMLAQLPLELLSYRVEAFLNEIGNQD